MKAPLSWLRDFVDVEVSPEALAERLTRAGLEVESIERSGRELDGVVVAEVIAVEPHPRAERLSVCRIRTGDDERYVVCGAPNVRSGIRVPYAIPGAELAGGRRIEAVDVRGVVSQGMLCSEAELGLGDDAAGLLLLPADAVVGQTVAAALGIEDTVLDVAVPPNRGDCLSILGLAREIAALYELKVKPQRVGVREQGDTPASALASVTIDDPAGCARYAARCVWGVRIKSSPAWMQRRLLAADLRPINNIVDATNYVMLERGQPLHAFDYDRLAQPRIVVRRAGTDTRIRTLDDRERELVPSDLLITTGERPIAIAGVMGGADSEVTADTRNLLLESAWFDPSTIRRTARRLGLRSEASFRFERGVDIDGVLPALDRAAALIRRLGGGRVCAGVVESYPERRRAAPIELRIPRIEFLLGTPVKRPEAVDSLRRLGARVRTRLKDTLEVAPPSYRQDLDREIDLIEEIVRLQGCDRIPTTLPTVKMGEGSRARLSAWEARTRRFLAAQGFHEMIGLSFVSPRANQLFRGIGLPAAQPVRIRNPIVSEEPELRMSLCPGLIGAVRDNLNHAETSVLGFAVGKVFWTAERPAEARRVAGVLCGSQPRVGLGPRPRLEFPDAKGALESLLASLRILDRVTWQRIGEGQVAFHPGKSALAVVDGSAIAIVGVLHPEAEEDFGLTQPCCLFELDLERALEYLPPRPIFEDLPRFPAVVRDVAVIAGADFASDRITFFIRQWNRQLVDRVELFDQYTGPPVPEGKKSLAYSIAYRAADRTLTDNEVNELHQQLLSDMSAALPIEFRH